MKNYFLHNDHIAIIFHSGQTKLIYYTPESGQVFYRQKINTVSDIKHVGILIGADEHGHRWFMHHHYETGKPSIVPEFQFSKGMPLFRLWKTYARTTLQIIEAGLILVRKGELYDALNNNCQTFVSRATSGTRESEDISKWTGRLVLAAAIYLTVKYW